MEDGVLKCSVNNDTNVVKIYTAKKLIEMKPGKEKKRKLTEAGFATGRWTKEEHVNFIKGKT